MGDLLELRRVIDQAMAASRVDWEPTAEDKAQEEAALRALRADRLKDSGAWGVLDQTARDCVLSGRGKLTPSLRAQREWARGDLSIHVMCGPTGTGKSTAAAWWLATSARKGHWLSSNRALRVLGRSWETPEQTAVLSVPLLVVDDVGRESSGQYEAMGAALLEIVDARRGRKTVITTNLTRQDFVQRYDCGRLGSRLHQGTLWTQHGGADMRLEGDGK